MLDIAYECYNGTAQGDDKGTVKEERIGAGGAGMGNRCQPVHSPALGEKRQ